MAEQRWSADDYVLDGRYPTDRDIEALDDELIRVTKTPTIIATFSAHYLLPGLSTVLSTPSDVASELRDRIRTRLREELRDIGDAEKQSEVERICRVEAGRCGIVTEAALHFGRCPDRPGDIAIVVLGEKSLSRSRAKGRARAAASARFGSRTAVFHRETAIDRSIGSELQLAGDSAEIPPGTASLRAIQKSIAAEQTRRILDAGRRNLQAAAVIMYDHDADSARMRLRESSPRGDRVDWVAAQVDVDEAVDMPDVPELGGSRFANLGELANLCIVKGRYLVGIVGNRWCLGAPFGSDPVGGAPVGVVCAMWRTVDSARLGSYELSFVRFIGTHLARIASERRGAASISTVARELALIGNPSVETTPVEELQGCAVALRERSDVGFIADSVRRVLRDMVRLSGAISVTCRLIAGSGSATFARSLFRVHCEGRECALNSPDAIDLDDWRDSVNAWVARNGSAVYLRSFPDDRTHWDELERYPDLRGARIYREGVASELCVPIRAEGRVVGTINLEADKERSFDLIAETIEEYAQLIGIALVEARRRIGVSMMTEAGGFLDRRHLLEGKLAESAKELKACASLEDGTRRKLLDTIDELTEIALLGRERADSTAGSPAVALVDVLKESMRSIKWTYSSADPGQFLLGDRDDLRQHGSALLTQPVAEALMIATNQVLLNVRKHGTSRYRPADWSEAFAFSFGSRTFGGTYNVGIAVHSVCDIDTARRTPSQIVFREPIHREGDHRTSLGAFVAGEVIRRVGGAAYFSWRAVTRTAAIATAELMVPIAPAPPERRAEVPSGLSGRH